MKIFKITYRINNEKRIQIFNPEFVYENKNKSLMIYNNRISHITKFFEIENKEKGKFKIILINFNNLSNTKYMFDNCTSLLEVFEIKDNIKYKLYKASWYERSSVLNLKELKNNIIIKNTGYKFSDFSNMYSGYGSKNIFNSFTYCGRSLLSKIFDNNWKINILIFIKDKKLENKANNNTEEEQILNEKSKFKLPDSFLNYIEIYKMIYNARNCFLKINIFGQNFVKTNRGKCLIIYENNILPLNEYLDIRNMTRKDLSQIEIRLIIINNIERRSYMFHNCSSLESFTNINEYNYIPNMFSNNYIESSSQENKDIKMYQNLKDTMINIGTIKEGNKQPFSSIEIDVKI